MSTRDEIRDGLAKVHRDTAAAHLWHHTHDTHCSCGFRTPLAQLALEGYLDHLAEEHAKATALFLADVLASEGLREAVARSLCESVNPGGFDWRESRHLWRRDADAALAVVRERVCGSEG